MKLLTEPSPKALMPFLGRRLVDWQLSSLAAAGISDTTAVIGYMPEAWDDVEIQRLFNPKWDSTNMVASLMCAEKFLQSGETVIISYGDIIYQPNILQHVLDTEGEIVVAVDLNWRQLWEERFSNPLDDAESLRLEDDGRIVEIGDPLPSMDAADAQYMGLIKLRPSGGRRLVGLVQQMTGTEEWLRGRSTENCYMTDVLRGLISTGFPVMAAKCQGGWLEFDTPEDIGLYTKLAANDELTSFIDVTAFG